MSGVTKIAEASHPNRWNYAPVVGGITGTSTAVTVEAAPADATQSNYVTSLQIAHGTLTASTEFAIRDGAGGTVLFRTALQTTANEMVPVKFTPPLRGSPGNLLEVVTLTAVTGNVYANLQGFTE